MKRGESSENIYTSDVFKVLFDYEITRAQRYPAPVALLEIEMHPVASNPEAYANASELFAEILSHHLRSVDIPSKAGNIFRIMLPTTSESGARAVCERLLSVFKNRFETPNGYSIVFSLHIGASAHNGGSTLSGADLLAKASEALKQSQQKGANTYTIIT